MKKFTFSDVDRLNEFMQLWMKKYDERPRLTGRIVDGRIVYTATVRA